MCMLADRDGNEQVHVAVAGIRRDQQELFELVKLAWAKLFVGRFVVVSTEAIPRNAAGKIERDRLKGIVQERCR